MSADLAAFLDSANLSHLATILSGETLASLEEKLAGGAISPMKQNTSRQASRPGSPTGGYGSGAGAAPAGPKVLDAAQFAALMGKLSKVDELMGRLDKLTKEGPGTQSNRYKLTARKEARASASPPLPEA